MTRVEFLLYFPIKIMLLVDNLYNSIQIIKSILKFNVLKNNDSMNYSATNDFQNEKIIILILYKFI